MNYYLLMHERNGNVRAISGKFEIDVVKQEDLLRVANMQALEWRAARQAHRAVEDLERRLDNGGTLEEGELYFDEELKMVRTNTDTGWCPEEEDRRDDSW